MLARDSPEMPFIMANNDVFRCNGMHFKFRIAITTIAAYNSVYHGS